jgi:hypothetical protein
MTIAATCPAEPEAAQRSAPRMRTEASRLPSGAVSKLAAPAYWSDAACSWAAPGCSLA